LGHEVSEEGINTDPNTVKAVKDWPRTKTPERFAHNVAIGY
jgi:hypothetical protein